MGDWGWTVLAGVAMVVGLCGVVIPLLPGLLLMWATGVVYGFATGWSPIAIVVMVVISCLVVASFVTGLVIPRRAAADSGASGWSQFGGVVGAVIGFFVIPVVGLIIGALLGVMAVEYLLKGSFGEAWTATKGLARGFGLSFLIEAGIGSIILVLWVVWAATVVF